MKIISKSYFIYIFILLFQNNTYVSGQIPNNDNKSEIQFLDLNINYDTLKTPKSSKTNKTVSKSENDKAPLIYKDYKVALPIKPPDMDIKYTIRTDGQMSGEIPEINIKDIKNQELSKEEMSKRLFSFYYNRGTFSMGLKEYRKAIKYFSKAIKNNTTSKDAIMMRGNAYVENEKYTKGLKDYNKAKFIDSSDATLFYNRAALKTKIEDYNGALSDYTTAINLRTDYTIAYMGRASLRTITNDYAGAIADYTEVLNKNVNFISAYRGRGVCYSKMQDWDAAEADFNYIISQLPEDGVSYYYLGLIKIKQNDFISACLHLNKAKQLGVEEAEEAMNAYCK